MPSPRPRRRAVGPAGARPSAPADRQVDGDGALAGDRDEAHDRRDPDERLVADRPPHHDRGV